MIHFIFLFKFCLFKYSFGTQDFVGLSQRSELQTSNVCSTKRAACLYIAGRYPQRQRKKKRKKKKKILNSRARRGRRRSSQQTDMCEMIPPMNDRESSSDLVPTSSRPTRPTDKHTNTETHERERRTASSSSLRMQRRKERVRYYILEGVYSVYSLMFSFPPNNLPAWYLTQKQLRRQ